jgi:methionyl-tRNA formyltransferase
MTDRLNVIFMGTPDFAVPSLLTVFNSTHHVCLVVTQPDRPKGRGLKAGVSPVKQTALQLKLPVVQPETVRGEAFADLISQVRPDVAVVIAFGQILPEKILKIPRLGAINLHASLLPKYRGPSPIQWAILNGETESGVTAMQMNAGLDTGDILFATKTIIREKETAAGLHDRLAEIAASMSIMTLDRLSQGQVTPIAQDESLATYAPKLKKTDGRIDWKRSSSEIERLIRAVAPWPGAYCFLNDRRYKILKADRLDRKTRETPGEVIRSFPDELHIATGENGALSVLEIQGASGKILFIRDFLRGTPITPGSTFE